MRWSETVAVVLLLGSWCGNAVAGDGLPAGVALSTAFLSELEITTAREGRFNPGDILDRERAGLLGAVVLSPAMAGIQGRLRLEGVRDLRGGGRTDTSAKLQELYSAFSLAEGIQLTVGKTFLAWDVSYASKPVNFFAGNTDHVDLEDHRRRTAGVPMVALSRAGKAGSLTGVFATDDAEGTGRGQWALRAQRHFGAAEAAALVRGQSGGPIGFGGTATYVWGRSLQLHGSLFASRGSDRPIHRAAAGEPFRFFGPGEPALVRRAGSRRLIPHLVAGFKYTTDSLVDLLVEFIHDGAGLSGGEWDRLIDAADGYARAGAFGAPRAAVAGNLAHLAASLRPGGTRRDYLFVRGSLRRGETEGSAGALIGLADRGISLNARLGHQPGQAWDVWAELRRSTGPGRSEFGEIPERLRLTLTVRFLF